MTTLHTAEELKAFINNRSIPLVPKRERIQVQLDSLDDKANNKLEVELNQLHAACGCAEGSIASVIGLALFVLYLTFIDIDATFSGMEALFYALGTFFTFMLVGKFGAILKAHLKLKKLPQRYL